MNITLVFPPFYLEGLYNLPPLGLITLGTHLRAPHRQVRILDCVLLLRQGRLPMDETVYDSAARMILETSPDLVGFSAQCTTYPAVVALARRVKREAPKVKIVVGGHNASFVDEETLYRYPFIDAIVRGEGEIGLREYVEALEDERAPSSALGITCREGGVVLRTPDRPLIADLDAMPLPDYTLAPPLEAYRDACALPRSIAILEVGRGCPHACIYCSESLLWRRRTRTFSVPRIVREMHHLREHRGAECFLLAYDQFTAQKDFVVAFCEALIAEGLDGVPWYCISRLDSVDSNLLSLMRRAGCESMCYGIDSGSKRTLAFIRKRIDQGILYSRVMETAEQGIVPTLSFVVGFPEEEREDIDETLTMALRAGVVGNNNPLIQMPTVLPGTDLHARYLGRLTRGVDTYFAKGIAFGGQGRLEEDESEIREAPAIYSSFYNLPCRGVPLEELGLLAAFFPDIVRLYPRTFLLLCLGSGASPSRLFSQWLAWLGSDKGGASLSASPQAYYRYFGAFCRGLRPSLPEEAVPHLEEILRYETLAIAVAEERPGMPPGDRDPLPCSKGPAKAPHVLVSDFVYDIPAILADLKEGIFDGSYPTFPVTLLLCHSEGRLQVEAINAFGRDLIGLCDGSRPVEAVVAALREAYQGEMSEGDFFDACRDAMAALRDLGYLLFSGGAGACA